ncbi:MAG: 3-oxoacyl-[acyl-carrier-protein] reductase FabG [SAR116 cluster bacterium]|jgi:3-oxoacyl-[acyl-carrier protein] reductase|nr:MAG: 3-oxoacyl-[acyl-carrier-protein] reductase FabG [SAR116 cluster bacterium]|tara:strand:+ start:625 stop:1416 length:792 start_codon:yes stop_codon:yes gene_type:complete
MDFELKGKLVLVTGGSRGIGKAIALMLADQGADLIICGRNQDTLNSAVEDIKLKGGQAWGFQADVSKSNEIEMLFQKVSTIGRGVSILVNNAVTSTSARFDELTDEEFVYHIEVKLMAYIRVARIALEQMKKAGNGRIVNIGGMTARIVAPLRMTNGVTNAGVANFTKQFANYAAQFSVNVNCVHPGYTATDRIMQIFKREAQESGTDLNAVLKKRTADIPLGKLIEPEDIASAVLFFCSPLSKMITGQCIAVDGGSGEAISY